MPPKKASDILTGDMVFTDIGYRPVKWIKSHGTSIEICLELHPLTEMTRHQSNDERMRIWHNPNDELEVKK